MTATEIYNMLGEGVRKGLEEGWEKAVLEVTYSGGNSAKFNGFYFNNNGQKVVNLQTKFGLPYLLAVRELQALTNSGESNRWNRLRFTLHPEMSFETDFIWDEDHAEVMEYINRTMDMPEPQRGNGLSELKRLQLERKTQRIYDRIARAVQQSAPAEGWQAVVVSLTRPPLHYEAQVQTAPNRRESLLLLGEADAIEALEELTQAGDHLRWESATLTLQPTGHYAFDFTWAGAREYNLPSRYRREGQIHPEPTSA